MVEYSPQNACKRGKKSPTSFLPKNLFSLKSVHPFCPWENTASHGRCDKSCLQNAKCMNSVQNKNNSNQVTCLLSFISRIFCVTVFCFLELWRRHNPYNSIWDLKLTSLSSLPFMWRYWILKHIKCHNTAPGERGLVSLGNKTFYFIFHKGAGRGNMKSVHWNRILDFCMYMR